MVCECGKIFCFICGEDKELCKCKDKELAPNEENVNLLPPKKQKKGKKQKKKKGEFDPMEFGYY